MDEPWERAEDWPGQVREQVANKPPAQRPVAGELCLLPDEAPAAWGRPPPRAVCPGMHAGQGGRTHQVAGPCATHGGKWLVTAHDVQLLGH